jgi:hypothetical protein
VLTPSGVAADICTTGIAAEPTAGAITPQSGGVGQTITVVAAAGSGGPPSPPEPLTTPAPLRGPGVVGPDDNGQTLLLAVGDTFELRLGSDLQWTVDVENEQIVTRAPDATVGPETQAIFQASAPGETTLAAYGEAPCRRAKPACMMPDIMFQITIVIR